MNRMEEHKVAVGAYSWSTLLRNSLYDAEPYQTAPALPSILAIRETLFEGLPWQVEPLFNIWDELKEDII